MARLKNRLSIAILLATAWPAQAAWPAPTTALDTSATRHAPPAAMTPDPKTRFWFGVAVENIPPNIARQLKLKPSQGLMIAAVLQDSPAESAGLMRDDLLIAINGHPLTSQDQLSKAANPVGKTRGNIDAAAHPSTLTYMRDGEKFDAEITPAPRPTRMLVFTTPGDHNSHGIKTYVMPNGGAAEVGPGIRMNLRGSDPADFTANSIKQIVAKGQTIILSQETDLTGNIKNTITVGTTVYTVDRAHLDSLPPDLRPLAQKMIAATPLTATSAASQPTSAETNQLEGRLKELERQNAELKKKVDALLNR